ncbi:MAG: sterol desaturase family protein [Bacteroidetes bacterium]|nr:sterol desaturase family protein [Bacteroidota bacterium]
METYGKLLLIAIPAFLVLILLEKAYGLYRGMDTFRNLDMISSLSSGSTMVTKDMMGLTVVILSYEWMVRHLAMAHIDTGLWTYVIAFLVLDFSGYWTHRIAHQYNLFWNNHIIHHSSEEFNLACALRQSISVFFRIFTFLLLPAALLGVPGKVIAIVAPLHLFAQFWYHTQHIGRMGWLEHFIVTPSHHRVHHAINPEYIDKNYSQIFIFWDRLFGTFQAEREDVPPVYGISRPVRTWNPLKINFMHLRQLVLDAWYADSWRDKLRLWWMPTGWRPADVQQRFPIQKIEDVYQYEKYDTPAMPTFHAWCWVQLTVMLGFLSWLLAHVADIGSPGIFLYGGFIFISIYAMTDMMDGNRSAFLWEAARGLYGGWLLFSQGGDWFGLSQWTPWAGFAIATYFILSLAGARWFMVRRPKDTHILYQRS